MCMYSMYRHIFVDNHSVCNNCTFLILTPITFVVYIRVGLLYIIGLGCCCSDASYFY